MVVKKKKIHSRYFRRINFRLDTHRLKDKSVTQEEIKARGQ